GIVLPRDALQDVVRAVRLLDVLEAIEHQGLMNSGRVVLMPSRGSSWLLAVGSWLSARGSRLSGECDREPRAEGCSRGLLTYRHATGRQHRSHRHDPGSAEE